MGQRNSPQSIGQLKVSAEYNNTLDLEAFALMLKDPSFCYKFYWLEALVHLITEGKLETTFDEIINRMIINAWYSVREFHIHLSGMPGGEVRDGLERAVMQLAELSQLPAYASSIQIENAIQKYDAELKNAKTQLTNMVPYRALSGFFDRCGETINWSRNRELIDTIERVNREVVELPYILGRESKLKKQVIINPAWAEMIRTNAVTILGWINCEKLRWLQTNNPEVPSLIYKLEPIDEKVRKLSAVHKLWDGVIENAGLHDIYNGNRISAGAYDVDHFIPWSFVMNDELWNLMPIDSSLNNIKSNHLPKWEHFFKKFATNQYLLYAGIHSSEELHRRFEACYRDNLHSLWAMQELYRKGNSEEEFFNILQKNMQPVYDSAKRQGYDVWNYGPQEVTQFPQIRQRQMRAASVIQGYQTSKD